jgi:hypothetical protein
MTSGVCMDNVGSLHEGDTFFYDFSTFDVRPMVLVWVQQ